MNLSLTLIVKNEEKNLKNCLKSFYGLWDKLIIVDTGSTDRTKEIASSFGAEIFDFEWMDDFSAARNFGLEKIKTNYTMTVDADDIIIENDKIELRKQLANIIHKHEIIALPYHYDGKRQLSSNKLFLPRIWKTNNDLRYIRPIHEYLNADKIDINLDIPILHNKTSDENRKSIERNFRILKKHIKESPGDFLSHFYLGKELEKLGQPEEAIIELKKGIQLSKNELDQINEAYTLIGKIYLKQGKVKKAKEALEKAINVSPKFIEAYLLLSEIEMNLYSIPKAIQLLTLAKNLTPPKTRVAQNENLYFGKANILLQHAFDKLK